MNGESYMCEFTSFIKNTHYSFIQIVSVSHKCICLYLLFLSSLVGLPPY